MISRVETRNNISLEFDDFHLHQACSTGNLGLVKYALSKNQPVNSVMFGLQALHLASASGNLAICKMLVEAGADVNAPRLSRKVNVSKEFLLGSTTGTTGYTPLHCAVSKNHFQIVQFLLDNQANAKLVDKFGDTAEMVARKRGFTQIEHLLSSSPQNQSPTRKSIIKISRLHPQKSLDNLALKLSRRSSTPTYRKSSSRERSDSTVSSNLSWESTPELDMQGDQYAVVSGRRRHGSASAPSNQTSFNRLSLNSSPGFYRPRKSSLLNPNLHASPSTGTGTDNDSPEVVFDEDSEEDFGASPLISNGRAGSSVSSTGEFGLVGFRVTGEEFNDETVKPNTQRSKGKKERLGSMESDQSSLSGFGQSQRSDSEDLPPTPSIILTKAILSPLYELPPPIVQQNSSTNFHINSESPTPSSASSIDLRDQLLSFDLSTAPPLRNGNKGTKARSVLSNQLAEYGKSLQLERKLKEVEQSKGVIYDVVKSSRGQSAVPLESTVTESKGPNPILPTTADVSNWKLAPEPSPLASASATALSHQHHSSQSRKTIDQSSNYHFETITFPTHLETPKKGNGHLILDESGSEKEKEGSGKLKGGLRNFFSGKKY